MTEASLARRTLEEIHLAGFEKAACQISNDELHELQAESGEINLFRTNFETDIRLSGIVDGRRASLGVNKTDDMTIAQAIKDLKLMAEGANQDPAFDISEAQPAEEFATGPGEPDYDLMYDRIKEVQDYAQTTGYDLVVGDGVLYASDAVNITENVLRAMEANFQAAGN